MRSFGMQMYTRSERCIPIKLIISNKLLGLSRLGFRFGSGSFYMYEMTIPISIGIISNVATNNFIGVQRSNRLKCIIVKKNISVRNHCRHRVQWSSVHVDCISWTKIILHLNSKNWNVFKVTVLNMSLHLKIGIVVCSACYLWRYLSFYKCIWLFVNRWRQRHQICFFLKNLTISKSKQDTEKH